MLLIIFFLIAGIVLFLVSTYNKLKREQLKVLEAKSNIGVYLEKRYDEISAIYKMVQEFKLHELNTFKEIVKLRQLAINKDLNFNEKIEIHNKMEELIPEMMATFENYPELRSSGNFLQLQQAIQENEENIASSRKSLNGYVNRFNTSIALFPINLFAGLLRFTKEELYESPTTKMGNPLL